MSKNRRTIFTVFVLWLVGPSVHAVTCVGSVPPDNPDSAYSDHGDGTITDVRTGLMWKRCAEGQIWDGSTCTGTSTSHTWQEALQLAADASYAGHSDWRLPNIKELSSLVEFCRYDNAMNDTIFPGYPVNAVWSSSPLVTGDNITASSAWAVAFSHGVRTEYSRGNPEAVRLVRGGN